MTRRASTVESIISVHNRGYPHIILTVRIAEGGNSPGTRTRLSCLNNHSIKRRLPDSPAVIRVDKIGGTAHFKHEVVLVAYCAHFEGNFGVFGSGRRSPAGACAT